MLLFIMIPELNSSFFADPCFVLIQIINTYEEHGEFRLGVVERDIRADEMGETFVDDLFDSLCASRSILR